MRFSIFPLCFICITVFAGCINPFEPVAPSWDVTLNVPVTNHKYTIQEIIDRNPSIFSVDPNGVLIYSKSLDLQPTAVGDALKLDGANVDIQSSVGNFALTNTTMPSTVVTLGQIAPAFIPLNGLSIPIPRTPFTLPPIQMSPISQFREATFATGTLAVDFQNNLPTGFEALSVTFFDQFGDIITASLSSPLPAGGSTSLTFPLANKHISNTISFRVSGTLASSGGPVVINTNAGVSIGLRFYDLTVSEAEARIPEITFSIQRTFLIDDSSSISQAEIKSGQFTITANIPFSAAATFTIHIPGLTLHGADFNQTIAVTKGQTSINQTYPLDGYILTTQQNQMNFTVDVRINDSGNEYVIIDAAQTVHGTVTLSNIILKSVTGTIKPTEIAVNRVLNLNTQSINKIMSGTTRIADASLVVRLVTPQQGFDIDVTGSIIGRNTKTGRTSTLAIPLDQRHVTAGHDSIVFQGGDVVSFFNSFTPQFPDEFTLNAIATANPSGTQQGTIHNTDSITGVVHIDLPINVSITGGVFRDTLSIGESDNNGNSKIDKSKSRDIQSARMTVKLENSLPVSFGLDSLVLLDKNHIPLLVIPKPGQPLIMVRSGQVTGGFVTQSDTSSTYIELNHNDADQFDAAEYVTIALHLDTPTTQTVSVRSTDWIKIKAISTVDYRANTSTK